jgi:hypothetical protein
MISFKCHHSLFLLLLLLLTLFVANVYFLLIHTGIAPDNLHSTTISCVNVTDTVVNDRQFRTISPPGGRQVTKKILKKKKGNSCLRDDPIKRERDTISQATRANK